jgi:hypothetical protein
MRVRGSGKQLAAAAAAATRAAGNSLSCSVQDPNPLRPETQDFLEFSVTLGRFQHHRVDELDFGPSQPRNPEP